VDEKYGAHPTFKTLAKAFLSFFQLPIRHDIGSEILSECNQNTTMHISGHIHEWHICCNLCKVDTTPQQRLDWFLRSLVPTLAKDVAMTLPQTKDEAINKAQQFDLIYSQSGYLYTVLPDAPCPFTFLQEKPRMSHVVDGLIGSMTNTQPHAQSVPTYGTNP